MIISGHMHPRRLSIYCSNSSWRQSLLLVLVLYAVGLKAQAQQTGPELLTSDELIQLHEEGFHPNHSEVN